MNEKSSYTFKDGLKNGIPIGLGYLFVSFGFGITAVSYGIPVIMALITSMTNLTSAGQIAGITIISAGGSIIEMILTQLVINIRYSLMSIALSQKVDSTLTTPKRLFTAFGITDEIYAVAASKNGIVGSAYMNGLLSAPYFGWALGTLSGAVAGSILPDELKASMGILIYGMFIAIVIPPAKKSRGVLFTVVFASVLSCLLKYMPVLCNLSSGFAVIICAVVSGCMAAILFPVNHDSSSEIAENGDNV